MEIFLRSFNKATLQDNDILQVGLQIARERAKSIPFSITTSQNYANNSLRYRNAFRKLVAERSIA